MARDVLVGLLGCCQGGCLGLYDILLLKYDVCFLQCIFDLCDFPSILSLITIIEHLSSTRHSISGIPYVYSGVKLHVYLKISLYEF